MLINSQNTPINKSYIINSTPTIRNSNNIFTFTRGQASVHWPNQTAHTSGDYYFSENEIVKTKQDM